MKILVTGGTGFLGARLIPQLVADGHDIFVLTRSASSHKKLRGWGASPVQGDLENRNELVLPAVDAVVHGAALLRFAGPRKPYFHANVDGTVALLEAAKKAGAKSFVYVSAAGIVMDDRGSPVRHVDESAPTYPDSFSGYLASKARAEAIVLAANEPGFRTIALRPPAIWGPGDAFSTMLPHAIESGRFAFIERGDHAFGRCHVDNVVEAIQCALQRGTGGSAYFINDQDTQTFREFIAMIAALQDQSIEKLRSMPYGRAFAIARFLEILWTLAFRKDDPPLTRTLVRMMGVAFSTSDAAARRDLGYVGKVSLDEGVRRYRQ
jgi:nucleoside-diphosphate-sugar epimerase